MPTRKYILLAAIIYAFYTVTSANAIQYGTDFNYKNSTIMMGDGWTISRLQGLTLTSNGVILDGSGGETTITYAHNVPEGIIDWKAGVRCTWLGGDDHSWLNIQVNTERHIYVYALDGESGEFVLLRDGIKVIGVGGYNEAANVQEQIYMEKNDASITLSYNSRQMASYMETDSSPVTSVSISSPPSSAAIYHWAGALIPEPSASGPIDGVTEETETPEEEEDATEDGEEPDDIPDEFYWILDMPPPPKPFELPALLASTAALEVAMASNPVETAEMIGNLAASYTMGMDVFLGASYDWNVNLEISVDSILGQLDEQGVFGGSIGSGGFLSSIAIGFKSISKVMNSMIGQSQTLSGSIIGGLSGEKFVGKIDATRATEIINKFDQFVKAFGDTSNVFKTFLNGGEIGGLLDSSSLENAVNTLASMEGHMEGIGQLIGELITETSSLSQSLNPEDVLKAQQQMTQIQRMYQMLYNMMNSTNEIQKIIIINLRG